MSKRSFAEISSQNPNHVAAIIDHADELLKAAHALRNDLEALRRDQGPESDALAVLKRHNRQIQSSAQLLAHDEVSARECILVWIDS